LEPITSEEKTGDGLRVETFGYLITGFHLDSRKIRDIYTFNSTRDAKTDPQGIGEIFISYLSTDYAVLATNVTSSSRARFHQHLIKHFQAVKPSDDRTGGNLNYTFEGEEITGRFWSILDANGKTAAYQLLVTSKTEALAVLDNLQQTIFMIAAVTLLFGFFIGYLTSKSVTRPVDMLVHAAEEISNGNMEHKITSQSKDELGFLSQTLDMMRVSILNRIKQIQGLQDQLIQKEKLAGIGSMATAINHEIRNQLSFGMAAELIRHKHPKDEELQSYTQMILDARDYILRMLDDIRNFTRADQHVEYTRETKNLKETLERTIAFCRFDNELKHVNIHEEYEDLGGVNCDHQRIGQVVINLVRNGGHAMDKGGDIHIRLTKKDHNVVIEVKDQGCGIPPENLEKIWDSFFSSKGEKGLGLGLDICKQIIEAHNGTIYCQSKLGEGASFFVELPMEESAPAAKK